MNYWWDLEKLCIFYAYIVQGVGKELTNIWCVLDWRVKAKGEYVMMMMTDETNRNIIRTSINENEIQWNEMQLTPK